VGLRNGRRGGYINVKDMYNNDVSKGGWVGLRDGWMGGREVDGCMKVMK
jgi:hypothetical protein